MIRRRNSVSLQRSRGAAEEDVDPSSYLVNLADCMLVMVIGLLVALVAHYGVDLAAEEQPILGQEVLMDADKDGRVDDGYTESGTVYRDDATGRYYMVPN